jgi:hypothetical protein
MKIAWDLDGCLAKSPPPSEKKWGHMKGDERKQRKERLLDHYKQAPILHKPSENFYVITARKKEPLVEGVTHVWLKSHFGDQVLDVFFLEKSRSLQNVSIFKTSVLEQLGITHFYEDNLKVLKLMKRIIVQKGLPTKLHYVQFDANGALVLSDV